MQHIDYDTLYSHSDNRPQPTESGAGGCFPLSSSYVRTTFNGILTRECLQLPMELRPETYVLLEAMKHDGEQGAAKLPVH